MKKFVLTFLLYLSLIGISYASNTIYLKCPQIITINDSSEESWTNPQPDLEDWPLNVGQKFNTNFAKIKLGKSKSSITPYHYDWLSVNGSDYFTIGVRGNSNSGGNCTVSGNAEQPAYFGAFKVIE